MNTLPDELLLEVIHWATDVASELDSNLDDRFRVPLTSDMEEMLKAVMPTRRALVRVSRRLWRLAIRPLYRSIIITQPQTLNLFFKSIMESGERSLLFRHGVRRFHLSILDTYQWGVAPGTEKLMKYLPNLKISCARGWPYPTKPLLFTALNPATTFPHLEAIQHSYSARVLIVNDSISNLLHSSPNLRVFLVPYDQASESKPKLYAFKNLRGCYTDAMIYSSPRQYSTGPNLKDTDTQPLLSQTPFPPLRSLCFTGEIHQNINHDLTRGITMLDLACYTWPGGVLDLSQFPQLHTLMLGPYPYTWYFKASDKNDKLRQVGVHSDHHPLGMIEIEDCQALVELVLGLPVRIQRLRFLGFALCRDYAALGLYQSIELMTWRKELEERGISLEGPDGVPFVEYLASLPR